MEKLLLETEQESQNRDPVIQEELLSRYHHAHALTTRFLKSTDPGGLGHLSASLIAHMNRFSKIAISNPEFKDEILQEIDKLVKHAESNIIKLKWSIPTNNNKSKLMLNQHLIKMLFNPAIEDIKNGRVYNIIHKDALPKKNNSWEKTLEKMTSLKSTNNNQKVHTKNQEIDR